MKEYYFHGLLYGQGIQVLSNLLDSTSAPPKTEWAWRGWRELVMTSESHPLCPTLWAGRREVDSGQKDRGRAELAENSRNHVRSWCKGFLIKSDFRIFQVCFQSWEQRREAAQTEKVPVKAGVLSSGLPKSGPDLFLFYYDEREVVGP